MDTAESTKPNSGDTIQKKILVVGDWFVDEHWVMGVHRSSTSSRTGDAHYRALHKPDSTVQVFCGAGQVASLLYQVKQPEDKKQFLFSIHGIGLWHPDDDKILENMFDFNNLKGQTLFKLSQKDYSNAKTNNPVELHNLIESLDPTDKDQVCTNRIIRIYHSVQQDKIRYYRMDWELHHVDIKEENLKDVKKLDLPEDIDAIVIKDLKKGVITKPLVEVLAKFYKDKMKAVQWFVSSKAWNPDWFDVLKDVKLQLLIIPPIAANNAIHHGDLSCWITRSGYPGEEAFECIDKILEKVGNNDNEDFKIIVLPKGFSAIAYMPYKKNKESEADGENIKPDCIIQTEEVHHPTIVPMGMASIFLPAMIAAHFKEEIKKGGDDYLQKLLKNCLRDTYNWVKHEGERISRPENWMPKNEFPIVYNSDEKIDEPNFNFKELKWELEKDIWKDATEGIAVINIEVADQKKRSYLELWRSMIEVDGYVCCVKSKKRELRKLIKSIEIFCHGEKKSHIGCMLVAAPGSGKTTLVRRMANSLNLRFLPFNITQMSSRTDIIDCFDTIVTTQAQDRNQPVLVFIDEINAILEGSPVYDAFLAPIEEGIYVRGGKSFRIDPCIWIFASTEDISKEENCKAEDLSKKRTDFISRLQMGIMDINQNGDVHRRDIENVYLGVNLLLNEFPDIRYISEKVLKAFLYIPSRVSTRKLKHFVKSFVNIQYGEVKSENVHIEFLKNIDGFDLKKWNGKSEGERVELFDFPSRNKIKKIVNR